jgi:zinc transporter ZupT
MTALLLGFAAFVSTLSGGWFALRFKDKLHLIFGFSAGAVIAVAFFDLRDYPGGPGPRRVLC